jgi:[methyl-Co(III) methanol-specific corrinoid protein]:coenzyme M methyltransferase
MGKSTPRKRVIDSLRGEDIDRPPCFSGMGSVSIYALTHIEWSGVHKDAEKMANLARASQNESGMESIVVPFDLNVEAEALGGEVKFYEQREAESLLYPLIPKKFVKRAEDIQVPEKLDDKNRIPVVVEAIKKLKGAVGDEVAVGSYVLGPFTLAGQVMELDELMKMTLRDPKELTAILNLLKEVGLKVADIFTRAGADYITVREMGAGTDILSPRVFGKLVQPILKELVKGIDNLTILHMCGTATPLVEMLHDCGANALSFDQRTDVSKARDILGKGARIFGNIDPVKVLLKGSKEDIERAVIEALESGVDGIMPGCDIWPLTQCSNIKAMVDATKKHGEEKWFRKNPVKPHD